MIKNIEEQEKRLVDDLRQLFNKHSHLLGDFVPGKDKIKNNFLKEELYPTYVEESSISNVLSDIRWHLKRKDLKYLEENKLCPNRLGYDSAYYPDCEYNVSVDCEQCRKASIKQEGAV